MANYWKSNEIDILKQKYPLIGYKGIKEFLPNRTKSSILHKVARLGIISEITLRNFPIYTKNENFFSIIDNDRAYWAGLIAADGYVNKQTKALVISFKETDKIILEKLKNQLNFNGPIHKTKKVLNNKTYFAYVLSIYSAKTIIKDLEEKYNIINKKSLILKPPINLTLEQALSFIIGYCDGDGCITIKNTKKIYLSFAGTKDMLIWISQIINKIENNKYKIREVKKYHKNIYELSYGCTRAYEILKQLQQIEISFRLARKWDKISQYEKLKGINGKRSLIV